MRRAYANDRLLPLLPVGERMYTNRNSCNLMCSTSVDWVILCQPIRVASSRRQQTTEKRVSARANSVIWFIRLCHCRFYFCKSYNILVYWPLCTLHTHTRTQTSVLHALAIGRPNDRPTGRTFAARERAPCPSVWRRIMQIMLHYYT